MTEKTVASRNCKLPHHINEYRKLSSHPSCTGSSAHSAKECYNRKTVKSKQPPTSTSSPTKVSVSPAYKAKKAVASSPVVFPVFDSGATVTTLPSSTFLSRTSTIPIPPIKMETAAGAIHTSESTGIF